MLRALPVLVLGLFASGRALGADMPKPLVLDGHEAGVPAVVFLADGKLLATGSEDKTIKLWTVADGKVVATLKGHADGVQSLAASPDSKWLASGGSDGVVKVWDVEKREEVLTLKGQKGDAAGLTFSPDGTRIAVGGGGFDKATDKAWGELRVWDTATGKEQITVAWAGNRVTAIAFSPDGAQLAAGSSDGSVAVWDARTGAKKADLGKNPNGAAGLAFSPDSKMLASGNFYGEFTITLWDLATGKELRKITTKATVSAFTLKFTPDGKSLAVGGFDQKGVRNPDSRGAYVALWDVEAGKERILTGHLRGVTCVAVSPDGKRLAASGLDSKVRVWELSNPMEE